jgi:hypothetical protein
MLSVLVFGILGLFSDTAEKLDRRFQGVAGPLLFFGMVVSAPVVETLMMSPILWVLSRIVAKPVPLAALSAAVWAGLHSLAAPAWGLIVAWPFYVFSRAYLAWRPYGWWKAVGVTACIHAFQNFTACVIALLLHG